MSTMHMLWDNEWGLPQPLDLSFMEHVVVVGLQGRSISIVFGHGTVGFGEEIDMLCSG